MAVTILLPWAASAAHVSTVELQAEHARFAMNPETGGLAAVDAGTGTVVLYPPEYLEGKQTDVVRSPELSGPPRGILYKKYKIRGVFVVDALASGEVHLLDGATLEPIRTIKASQVNVTELHAALSSSDPYIYYTYQVGYGGKTGRINLARLTDEGTLFDKSCLAVSPSGRLLYCRQGVGDRSLECVEVESGSTPGEKARLHIIHKVDGEVPWVAPDPSGDYTVTQYNVYSPDLKTVVAEARLPYVKPRLFAKRPLMASSTGTTIHVWSLNTYQRVATVPLPRAVADMPRSTRTGRTPEIDVLADDAHERLIVTRGNRAALVPLDALDIPEEPRLFVKPAVTRVPWGRTTVVPLEKTVADMKVELAGEVPGVTLAADGLRFTPAEDQVGRCEVPLRLSHGTTVRVQTIGIEVGTPGLKLAFVPTGVRANPSGTRVVLWAQKRVESYPTHSPPPSHMALIDATAGQVLVDKLAACNFCAVDVDDHHVYVAVTGFRTVYALSLDDLSPRLKIQLPDDPAKELAAVGGKHLIAATERGGVYCYSLPGLKPAFKLDPLAPASEDPKKRPNIGAAASLVVEGEYVRYQGVVHDAQLRSLALMRPPAFMLTVDHVPAATSTRPFDRDLPAIGSPLRAARMSSSCQLSGSSLSVVAGSSIAEGALVYRLDVLDRRTGKVVESWPLKRVSPPPKYRQARTGAYVRPVGKDSVVVTIGAEAHLCNLLSHAAEAPAAMPRFAPVQSGWTVAADEQTDLEHTLAGAARPVRAELTVLPHGVSVDPTTTTVTVDGPSLMAGALETLALKFGTAENPFTPGSLQLQQYTALAGPYFERVVGRKPTGVPLLVPIDLQVTDAKGAEMGFSYYVFLEVPSSAAGESIARSEAEAKQRMAEPTDAPDRKELVSRADKLNRELQRLHHEATRLEQALEEMFEERSRISGDPQ
jgi:hypothetical protein